MELLVNGERHRVAADPRTPLLWVIRDHIGLTGTKFGCGIGVCGACTIHLDGQAVRACVTPASAGQGKAVVTIEGLQGAEADALRRSWLALDVPQCGYCQSGQLMTAVALLRDNPRPDAAAVNDAMNGNLCRCGTYPRIRRAIARAADEMGPS